MPQLTIGRAGGKPYALPETVITSTAAILAKKDAGKTYTAGVIEEEMAKAHMPFVVLDPIGVHWGLRSSADGKRPWAPAAHVIIFGGQHGDVPLDQRMGKDLAAYVAEDNVSCIIDLSELPTKGAWREFIREFCVTLFRANRGKSPRHVFLEEATELVPQRPMPGMQPAYEAVERMTRLGRNNGIGITMIAQRSAQISKDVLSQIDYLIAMRHTGKHDIDAIIDAVRPNLTDEQLERELPTFRRGVTKLAQGSGWLWWPAQDVFTELAIRKRESYHAGRTPTLGAHVAPVMTKPDVPALRERFKAIVDESEANDPKLLKKRIAELEAAARKAVPQADPRVPELEAHVHRLEAQVNTLVERVGAQRKNMTAARDVLDAVLSAEEPQALPKSYPLMEQLNASPAMQRFEAERRNERIAEREVKRASRTPPLRVVPPSTNGDSRVSKPQQRILDTLASLMPLGVTVASRSTVGVLAHVSPKSSGFEKNVSTLRTLGLVEYPSANMLALTDEGVEAAALPEGVPTLSALHSRWFVTVSRPQADLLKILIVIWPRSYSREELAEKAGVSAASSGFEKNISTLRSYGVVTYPQQGHVAATELLFPRGLADG